MKTIRWTCSLGEKWEWLSVGNPSLGISQSVIGQSVKGEVTLPLCKDYWHPCARVVLQGVTTGDAMLRVFEENGQVVVQAQTVAQGSWLSTGTPGTDKSLTDSKGGINLVAQILN